MKIGAEKAINNLFQGVIPERMEDVKIFIRDYLPSFFLVDDKPFCAIEAGPYGLLTFTNRTMRLIWLLGFASKKALDVASGYIRGTLWLSLGTNFSGIRREVKFSSADFESFLASDLENDRLKWANDFNRMIDLFYSLAEIENVESFVWPNQIPHPEKGKPKDLENSTVFELVCLAAGFIFLHETKHIMFISEGNPPKNRKDEEFRCDRFAVEMYLGKVPDFCNKTGDSLEKVLSKRATGVFLAYFFILALSSQEKVSVSTSHPDIFERVSASFDDVSIDDNDPMWLFAASVCLMQSRFLGKTFNLPSNNSFKTVCQSMLKILI